VSDIDIVDSVIEDAFLVVGEYDAIYYKIKHWNVYLGNPGDWYLDKINISHKWWTRYDSPRVLDDWKAYLNE